MNHHPINILFTCAGRRNYLVNYFKEALNGNGQVLAADQQLNAPALVDADIAIKLPNIYNPDYIETLIDECKKNKVDAIVSLNDLELPILAKHAGAIQKSGIRALISDPEVIDIAFDKWKTYEYILSLGLKAPKTFKSPEAAIEAISNKEISFPLVLKPRWGSASIGIEFPENEEELRLAYDLQRIRISRSILNNASSQDINSAILIQEKISGKEFGMDVLNDFDGNYVGTFAREKLTMRSGETDKAVSVINQNLEHIGSLLGGKLKHIGNMDCDVLYDGSDYYVLELNPRFGGGYPFSHEAGINTAAIYIEWLRKSNATDQFINYKEGLCFSKYDRLMPIRTQPVSMESIL